MVIKKTLRTYPKGKYVRVTDRSEKKKGSSYVSPFGGVNHGGGSSFSRGGNSFTDPSMTTKCISHMVGGIESKTLKELGSINRAGLFTNKALAIVDCKGVNHYLNVDKEYNLASIRDNLSEALTEEEFILSQEKACMKRGSGFVYTNMSEQEYSEYNDN